MKNFIDNYKDVLREDHYIRSSQLNKLWVYFSRNKLLGYRKLTGDEFCLVISGKHDIENDFYSVPFNSVSHMFTDETLSDTKDGYSRWNCWIEDRKLKTKGLSIDISQYYGNRTILGYPSESYQYTQFDSILSRSSYDEGNIRYRIHLFKERSRSLVQKKKQLAMQKYGELRCEVCGMTFKEVYGDIGGNYIECHHRIPISKLSGSRKTRLKDISLVCSNCHSMLHASKDCMGVEELAVVVKKKTSQI